MTVGDLISKLEKMPLYLEVVYVPKDTVEEKSIDNVLEYKSTVYLMEDEDD